MEKVRNNCMKSTGVVRRVDELGRIVIPKEIRRTLRIKDGESLEIFVDREMITLRKYSKLNNMEEDARQLADIISRSVDKNVFITDCACCLAGWCDPNCAGCACKRCKAHRIVFFRCFASRPRN